MYVAMTVDLHKLCHSPFYSGMSFFLNTFIPTLCCLKLCRHVKAISPAAVFSSCESISGSMSKPAAHYPNTGSFLYTYRLDPLPIPYGLGVV